MTTSDDTPVSRERYNRERAARNEAELLLERLGTELFRANESLSSHSAKLEQMVLERTAELRAALELARHETSVRTRFIATMSHEIRTPLGGLLGMIDLLEMDETDPNKQELLKNAKSSGLALKRIVNDVLDFAKMDAGVFVFVNEAVDLRALIDSITSLAKTNLTQPDRSVRAKIDQSVPKLFSGDATRIRQVISNFVSNATRYSEDGPIIIRARANGEGENLTIRVEVEDFGIGIAADKMKDLFKDFSQISNSLTASAQGTGLGLAITRRIIESCGGTIGVESTLGEGSTFWFELPIKPMAEELTPSKSLRQVDAKNPLEGLRVLLAEDNPINQKLLMTFLTRMGLVPELARNGAVAIKAFKPSKFDLVIMDVAMPEVDGLEAVRVIQKTWAGVDLPPIIFLTAHEMPAIHDEAKQLNAARLLSKPIPYEELREAITSVIVTHEASPSVKNTPKLSESPVPSSDPASPPVISPAVKDELLASMSSEEMAELFTEYVKDSYQIVDRIRICFGNKDFKSCRSEAHSLKGASRFLGAAGIAEEASRIEAEIETFSGADLTKTLENIRQLLDGISAET